MKKQESLKLQRTEPALDGTAQDDMAVAPEENTEEIRKPQRTELFLTEQPRMT